MDPLKKLKEYHDIFPKTESNSLCHQMALLETARDKLRKFCQTFPKCKNDLNCETCKIGEKVLELDDWIDDLGFLQDEIGLDEMDYLEQNKRIVLRKIFPGIVDFRIVEKMQKTCKGVTDTAVEK